MTTAIERAGAAQTFAGLMGWRLSASIFSMRSLAMGKQHDGRIGWQQCEDMPGSLVDHADYFRQGRVPAGIVSHTYLNTDQALKAFAASCCPERGLAVAVLPILSWYSSATIPVLIGRPTEIEAVLARLPPPP